MGRVSRVIKRHAQRTLTGKTYQAIGTLKALTEDAYRLGRVHERARILGATADLTYPSEFTATYTHDDGFHT